MLGGGGGGGGGGEHYLRVVYQVRPFFARRPLPTLHTRKKGLAKVSVGMQFIG